MTLDKLQLLAAILAIVGISNWIFGGISWRGQMLNLRKKNPWVAMRWIGIGLLAGFTIIGTTEGTTRELVGIFGSILVLLGSARTRELPAPNTTKSKKAMIDK